MKRFEITLVTGRCQPFKNFDLSNHLSCRLLVSFGSLSIHYSVFGKPPVESFQYVRSMAIDRLPSHGKCPYRKEI